MSLLQDLQKIGLTDKEAKVYLAVLEVGQETAQNIAEKAGVNRATTYVIIESLAKKGLISQFQEGKKTFFAASSPESLRTIFELQKKEIESRQDYLDAILPQLKTMANTSGDKPVIRFYEGIAGIEAAHEDFFTAQDKNEPVARMFFPIDRVKEIFSPEVTKRLRSQRLANNVVSRVLYNSDKITLENTVDGKRVKVSSSEFPFTCDVAIFGDSIRIASLGKKLSAVLIKDKDIANTFKSIFDLAWKSANIVDSQ